MCIISWEDGENQVLVKKTQKHVFCALSLNISYKIHLFFGENFLVALDTYVKKINPPSIVLGGGVHGKSCWLIAY